MVPAVELEVGWAVEYHITQLPIPNTFPFLLYLLIKRGAQIP